MTTDELWIAAGKNISVATIKRLAAKGVIPGARKLKGPGPSGHWVFFRSYHLNTWINRWVEKKIDVKARKEISAARGKVSYRRKRIVNGQGPNEPMIDWRKAPVGFRSILRAGFGIQSVAGSTHTLSRDQREMALKMLGAAELAAIRLRASLEESAITPRRLLFERTAGVLEAAAQEAKKQPPAWASAFYRDFERMIGPINEIAARARKRH